MRRSILVGDIHGCRQELETLLDRSAWTESDDLVFVGDLLARGPDPLGVLEILRRTHARSVLGNHEEKLLVARRAGRASKSGHGVAQALGEEDWALLEGMPLFLDLSEQDVRVVHAGILPGVPWERQERHWLLTIRTVNSKGHADERRDGGIPWGSTYRGPPHVVFGHNARPEPQLHRWATGLDTGCVYGGELTALVLAAGQTIPADVREREALLVRVRAARVYSEPQSWKE